MDSGSSSQSGGVSRAQVGGERPDAAGLRPPPPPRPLDCAAAVGWCLEGLRPGVGGGGWAAEAI